MSRRGPDVVVAGGGIAGLAVALALSERGAAVRLHAPGGAPSASAVAAGMISPALEAVFDPLSAGRFTLLRAAAGLWPERLDRAGLSAAGLWRREGAVVRALPGEDAALEALERRLAAIGAGPERLEQGVLCVAEEARVAPERLLAALHRVLAARGVEIAREPLADRAAGDPPLVIAAGAGSAGLAGLAPEFAVLEPIRGQILAFAAGCGPAEGPTLRRVSGGYLAPQADGALAGGTMEPGRRDLEPDAAVAERLRAQAALLDPSLADAPASSRVGVRASTPDGLPLAGASRTPGVWVAAGMRRNGWLLAPMVAEVVAAGVLGGEAPAEAALFAPGRFGA